MSFCKNCGIKLDDDAKFCPSCGAPVVGTHQSRGGEKESSPVGYIIIGVVVILSIVGYLYYYQVNKNIDVKIKNKKVLIKMVPEIVYVKGGTFYMGSNDGESDEKPIHKVIMSDFYIGKYEVTFEEYEKFCESTRREKPDDNGWGRGKRPVINVCWYDAVEYCKWLSEETGKKYRLPTEAEWEYASKGGLKSAVYKYSGSNNIDEVAWYDGNSGDKTHPVGTKQPNELGIYDMSGNVWEWCSDWYDEDYYSKSPSTDPKGPSSGEYRVFRGGGWYNSSVNCRSALRGRSLPDYMGDGDGFRCVQEK